jgi:hypothetical protein
LNVLHGVSNLRSQEGIAVLAEAKVRTKWVHRPDHVQDLEFTDERGFTQKS